MAKYEPDPRGIRELAQDPAIQSAALAAGSAVQSWAKNDDPTGDYSVRPATVPSGWDNEPRAGAIVEETREGEGAARRSLVRASQEARS